MTDSHLNFLHDKRRRAHEAALSIVEHAHAERRADLTGEEDQAYTRAMTEYRDLGQQIDEATEDLAQRAAADEARASIAHFITPNTLERGDPIDRFFRNQGGPSLNVSFGEVRQQMAAEQRSLLAGSGQGTLGVPTTMERSIYSALTDPGAVWRLNPRIISTTSGESLTLPKMTAPGTGTVVPEAGTITAAEPTLAQVTFASYKYGGYVELSSEIIADAAFDIVSFIAQNAGAQLALGYDPHMIVGTGSGQPEGAMKASGTIATGGTLIGVTAEKLIDLQMAVPSQYRGNGCSWLMKNETLGTVRKFRADASGTTGPWLLSPPSAPGAPETLFGAPVVLSESVAQVGSANAIVGFGNYSRCFGVREAGPLRFERSDHVKFREDLVAFRAAWRLDSRIIDQNGIKALHCRVS